MAQRNHACAHRASRTVLDVGRGVNNQKRAAAPRGRPRQWTEARVRQELAEVLGHWTFTRFPTGKQFKELGAAKLLWAMERHGGLERWAREFDMPVQTPRDRTPYGLTAAKRDALAVIAAVGVLPGGQRLKLLGKPRLASSALLGLLTRSEGSGAGAAWRARLVVGRWSSGRSST